MHESGIIFITGLVAGACTSLSFIPQVFHIWKRRSAADISGIMYSFFSFGSFLWLLYGLGIQSIPISLANGVALALNIFILILKRKFTRELNSSSPTTPSTT
jgi:MtN3 and saliva related transmembrane protein